MLIKILSDFESPELGVFEEGTSHDMPPEIAALWVERGLAEKAVY